MLDVRLPIGGLFFILGIMIGAWGYTHPPLGAIAAKMGPLPINFDIIWGILMTLFGMAMYSLAKLDEALGLEQQLKEEKTLASARELGAAIVAAPQSKPAASDSGAQPSAESSVQPSAQPSADAAAETKPDSAKESAAEKTQGDVEKGTTDGADKETK